MRRFVITLGAIAVLVLLPAQAAWAGDLFAVGNGTLAGRETSFSFSVHLSPSGGSGHAVIVPPST